MFNSFFKSFSKLIGGIFTPPLAPKGFVTFEIPRLEVFKDLVLSIEDSLESYKTEV
jgi:hypothetical protein